MGSGGEERERGRERGREKERKREREEEKGMMPEITRERENWEEELGVISF